MSLSLVPVTFREASDFVAEHHRHHLPARGWKFGVGVAQDGVLVGVAIIGRPSARCLDDGLTLEVTRLCVSRAKNAASMLYGAAWRATRAMGYLRLKTYTLDTETGASLIAAGFTDEGLTQGGSWDTPTRRRTDKAPTCKKRRWGKAS